MKSKKIVLGVVIITLLAAGLIFWLNIHGLHSKHKSNNSNDLFRIEREYGNVRARSKIQLVSLINLIATPEKYHGKWVSVVGVSNFEFEGDALYLSKADYKLVTKNSVWLSPDTAVLKVDESTLAKEFNGRIVLVEGIFDMNNHGHMSLHSGAITHASRIMSWVQK